MSPIRPAGALHARDGRCGSDRGFMMVAILIGLGVAAIMMTAALPAWRQQVQRTREEDLIFRGEQYARAIALYQIKNRGAYPPTIDALVSGHYLRKKWKDPVANDDFIPVGVGIVAGPGQGPMTPVGGTTPTPAGRGGTQGGGAPVTAGQQPGISGVRSRSTATSIKIYQQQQQHNLWAFDASFALQKMGVNPGALSGQGGRQGGAVPGRGGQAPGTGLGPGRGTGPGQAGPGQGGRGATGPGRGGATPPPTGGTGRTGRGGT